MLPACRAVCAAVRSPSTQSLNSARSALCLAPTRPGYLLDSARHLQPNPGSGDSTASMLQPTRLRSQRSLFLFIVTWLVVRLYGDVHGDPDRKVRLPPN